MKAFVLRRIIPLPAAHSDYRKRAYYCDSISVLAPTEERARAMASERIPRFGFRLRKDNTAGPVGGEIIYDVTPMIWADPATTACTEVADYPQIQEARLIHRAFVLV